MKGGAPGGDMLGRSGERGDAGIILLGSLLSLCSAGAFYVVPEYLSALESKGGFNLSQLGLISGLENLCIAVACLLTSLRIGGVGVRLVLASTIVGAAGNLATLYLHDFGTILALRCITGLFGEGPLYAVSFAVLGRAANPDRAFGIGLTSMAILAAIIFFNAEWIEGMFGPGGVFLPYAAAAACLFVVTLRHRQPLAFARQVATQQRPLRARAAALLLSIAVLGAVTGGFWSFASTAGNDLNVDPSIMTRAFSIGIVIGLAGAIAPVLIGSRFGRVGPLAASCAGLVLSSLALLTAGQTEVVTAIALLQLCWNLSIVYQLAGLAAIDIDGRLTALGAFAQIAGTAIGPIAGGFLLDRMGLVYLTPAVAVGVVGAFSLFIAGSHRPGASATYDL